MRPLTKGPWPKNGKTKKVYSPYDTVKEDLFNDIGNYCSFCESYSLTSSLAVEHIQAKNCVVGGKKIYAHLEEDWRNFLIACVHCNSVKGDTNVILSKFHLPHRNNTMLSFVYGDGGLVSVNPDLSAKEIARAQALLDLVGLDRLPGDINYSRKDKRWDMRRQAWELALKYLIKYERKKADVETIVDLASERGYWSIWMSVFSEKKQVKKALVKAFKGTFKGCLLSDVNRK